MTMAAAENSMEDAGRKALVEYLEADGPLITHFNVYADELRRWQQKFNLVANSTIPEIWQRHFLDSAQIMPHVPRGTEVIVDLGSGAGFPGLVLALLGDWQVHLVEANGKKAAFLSHMIRKLALENVTLHQGRIEASDLPKADLVTARALASLPQLLDYMEGFAGPETEALFLKGATADEEIAAAEQHWELDVRTEPSVTSDEGRLVMISAMRRK